MILNVGKWENDQNKNLSWVHEAEKQLDCGFEITFEAERSMMAS